MDDVITRAVEVDDAGEVLTLQRAAYATEAQLYGDPFLPALTQSLDELRKELAGYGGLVSIIGGRVVASIRWTVQEDVAHIGRLIVAPDQQGRGLGTRLLRLAEQNSGAGAAEFVHSPSTH